MTNTFFKLYHTDHYKWYDFFLFPVFMAAFLILTGQLIGLVFTSSMQYQVTTDSNSSFVSFAMMYLSFIGIWFFILLYLSIFKHAKPILTALSSRCKGNNLRMLGVGLLIGFAMNASCIASAIINKDISINYDSFQIVNLLLLFVFVFIQSSAEELTCRCFLYQRLRHGYKQPAIAIVINALFFAALHVFNDGVTFLALFNIFLSGIACSLLVYYYDSLWAAMALHAAWNYTQNIIFGLPNSGIVSASSIFKLDSATATNSPFYDVAFGVEGTIMAVVVHVVAIALLFYFGRKRNTKPLDIWNNTWENNTMIQV